MPCKIVKRGKKEVHQKRLTCCHPLKNLELEHCLSCKSITHTQLPTFENLKHDSFYEIMKMEGRFYQSRTWNGFQFCCLDRAMNMWSGNGKAHDSFSHVLNERYVTVKSGRFGCYFRIWCCGRA